MTAKEELGGRVAKSNNNSFSQGKQEKSNKYIEKKKNKIDISKKSS